ncbi:peptide chain release factor N(5)-glutamine methyltransferase [Rhodohalobacter sp. 614A]|uniref:peptide chain release factor N(5)-glutamine methyltransferase n=1 Tax=Rhodohalobacter sp. 614A TaxID=2908649 RepID=UPI001F3C5211|nr:peptide chain release factor N(5)-glutamine methyltransferase [Rhodohalobacter sp. 614A]
MSGSERVWTVLSMLEWATDYFKQKDVPDPRLSIEWIVAEALQCKRLDLYLQFERPLSSDELDAIRPLVKRRASLEPLQYILGSTEFINATITVDSNVLIPRIETEQLVDLLLDHFRKRKHEPLNLLDIGTGSGCIPIAIKKENPDWYCAGFDISEKAIERAKKNAGINETDVDFFKADILQINQLPEGLQKEWDIIISNPPYITEPEKAEMHKQVTKHEPHLALFHDDPLKLYSKIIEFAAAQNASLYLECNDKTAPDVLQIASRLFSNSKLFKDLDQNERFVVASPNQEDYLI